MTIINVSGVGYLPKLSIKQRITYAWGIVIGKYIAVGKY